MDSLLGRKSSISLTNKDKPIYAVKTDFVSQVYIIRIKTHDQNKNAVGAKTRSLVEWIFVLFLLPKRFAVNSKSRRNATRQPLLQMQWKFIFSHTIWLLEVAIIARTNYNCKIGHCAQPVKSEKTNSSIWVCTSNCLSNPWLRASCRLSRSVKW